MLSGQRRAYSLQLLLFLAAYSRICEVECLDRFHDSRANHEAREPLVVSRHDKPGRVRRGRSAYRLFLSDSVVGPETSLVDVRR